MPSHTKKGEGAGKSTGRRKGKAGSSPRRQKPDVMMRSLQFALHGAHPLRPWLRSPPGGTIPLRMFANQLPPRKETGGRIAVISGIVGAEKSGICETAAAYAQKLYGITPVVYHVGRRMYQLTRAAPGRILYLPPDQLRLARQQVFAEICSLAAQGRQVIVNTHATFQWHDGTVYGFDDDNIAALKAAGADTFISVLDNVPTVYTRLRRDHAYQLTLAEVAAWRTIDEAAMRHLAAAIAGPNSHFIIGRGTDPVMVDQTALAIAKRIFGPRDLTVVYACFPMTFAFHRPEMMASIRAHCDALARKVISQNPASVDEWAWYKEAELALARNEPTFAWQVAPGEIAEFSTVEVILLGGEVESEIVGRDYAKVDQAHIVAAYVPARTEDECRPSISAGMQKELAHAHAGSKVIGMAWEPAGRHKPSPFDKQHCDWMFPTVSELIAGIPERVEVVPNIAAATYEPR